MSRALATALLGVVLATAGCGVGAGSKPGGTKLTITQDFGAKPVRSLDRPAVGGSETVMRLLARNAKVTTRYGGGFVQSIDGLAGSGARQLDWFYYVNGVEAPKGAAATRLHAGDHVWWDRHDWSAAMRVPAVVGAFPEPFVHGIGGKRLPVRVECSDPAGEPCAEVAERLASYKIPAARGGLRTAHIEETLRVLVGPWAALRDDDAIDDLERGPAASGVYARPSADGRTIALLDAAGHRVRTLGPGTGLVAATRRDDDPPTWVVTGTDAAGASSAARAFEEGTLEDRFALAVSHDLPIPLPEAPRS